MSENIDTIMSRDCSAFTGFFNTDDKRIDLVLVMMNRGSKKTQELRINFLTNIIKFGLEVELDQGKMIEHRSLVFVKIHAPDSIIEEYGLFFNIRKFFKDNHVEHINLFLDPLGINHERELIKQLRRNYPGPANYSTLERSIIVYNIINRLPYEQRENFFGINRLMRKNIIYDAYALHDGPYFLASGQGSANINGRQTLFYSWLGTANIWRTQPINLIQEYLGDRVALYFAFYEYFNLMLLFPAIIGAVIAFTHYFGERQDLDNFGMHICHNKELENYIICPHCRHFDICPVRLVHSYCTEIKFINHIDTKYSQLFGFLISVWGIFFIMIWKRRENYLKWIWEIKGKYQEYVINPENQLRKNYRSNLTGVTLDKFNFTAMINIIFTVSLNIALFSVWVFSMFLLSTQIWYIKYWLDVRYNKNNLRSDRPYEHLFIAIGAGVYSIITTALKIGARTLSHCLTAVEPNKTIGAYNFSLAIKLYIFYFTGTFTLLTFHIFVGTFTYTHILDMDRWYSIAGFKVMTNRLGSSFDDIAITLGIAILIEQIILKIPIYFCRKSTDYQGSLCRNAPSWEREYKLKDIKDHFHDYYNELLIQFAMSSLFSMTFTLAPFLILVFNMWDIRHKARTILLTCRRPLLHNISGSAIWHKLFLVTSFFIPIFNVFILGLQSRRFLTKYAITIPSIGFATIFADKRYPFNGWYQPTYKETFDLFDSSFGQPNPKDEFKKLPRRSGNVCNDTAQEHYFYKEDYKFVTEYRHLHAQMNKQEFVLLYSIISVLVYLFLYFHFPISNDDIEDTFNTETRIKQKYFIKTGFLPNQE